MTALLEKAGHKTLIIGGKSTARNRFLANAVWQAITEKKIQMPDGSEMMVGPDDWWNAVEFIYKHIDGPPIQNIDHEGEITLNVVYQDKPDKADDNGGQ